jgi:hypothetical protein
VPGTAAKLAVGCGLQTNIFLHGDDVADRIVLDAAQLLG